MEDDCKTRWVRGGCGAVKAMTIMVVGKSTTVNSTGKSDTPQRLDMMMILGGGYTRECVVCNLVVFDDRREQPPQREQRTTHFTDCVTVL
mmetsp:Transcript_12249/g.18964  ORF Transcript_12249/g.18964 Transcript_12249/m.18964 type:complete len:90 (-) Transcript_12249:62-331(-)